MKFSTQLRILEIIVIWELHFVLAASSKDLQCQLHLPGTEKNLLGSPSASCPLSYSNVMVGSSEVVQGPSGSL